MKQAIAKVQSMSNNQLKAAWEALRNYDPSEQWGEGISMDDWAQLIYSEMDQRGIPHF